MSDELPDDALVISVSPGETRAAHIEAGLAVALTITRRDRQSRVGDVWRARVTRIDRAIRGAFIDLGPAGDGFLGFEAGGEALSEGEKILVQIKKDAENGKPMSASLRIELAGRLAVFSPTGGEIAVSRRLAPAQRRRLAEEAASLAREGEGWQVRTAAAIAPPEALASEMASLRDLAKDWNAAGEPGLVHAEPGAVAQALRDTIEMPLDLVITDDRAARDAAIEWCRRWRPELADHVELRPGPDDLFASLGLDAEIDQALAIRVPLQGGGTIIIETTRALTSIDVDRAGAQAHPAEIDERAAEEAVRQIRLRDIGGMILVDFLRLREREDREFLLRRLREEAQYDPLGLEVLGFTRAGLVELTRPRRRQTLADVMLERCDTCAGAARIASPHAAALAAIRAALREAHANPARRIAIAAAPAIAHALAGVASGAAAEAAERLGRAIEITADPDLAPDRWEIRGA